MFVIVDGAAVFNLAGGWIIAGFQPTAEVDLAETEVKFSEDVSCFFSVGKDLSKLAFFSGTGLDTGAGLISLTTFAGELGCTGVGVLCTVVELLCTVVGVGGAGGFSSILGLNIGCCCCKGCVELIWVPLVGLFSLSLLLTLLLLPKIFSFERRFGNTADFRAEKRSRLEV